MTENKVYSKVLGEKSPNVPKNMFKDSDGDGKLNVFDCQPYDKKRQGYFDDAKAFAKRKIAGYKAERNTRRDVEDQVNSGEITSEKQAREKFQRGSVGEKAAIRKLEQQDIEEATRIETQKQRKQQAVGKVKDRFKARSSGSAGANFAGLSNLLVGGSAPVTTTRRRSVRAKVPVRRKSKAKKRKTTARRSSPRVTRKEVGGILNLRL